MNSQSKLESNYRSSLDKFAPNTGIGVHLIIQPFETESEFLLKAFFLAV